MSEDTERETWAEFKQRAMRQFEITLNEAQDISAVASGAAVATIKIATEFALPGGEWGTTFTIDGIIIDAVEVPGDSTSSFDTTDQEEGRRSDASKFYNNVMNAVRAALDQQRTQHAFRQPRAISIVVKELPDGSPMETGTVYGLPAVIIADCDAKGIDVITYESA